MFFSVLPGDRLSTMLQVVGSLASNLRPVPTVLDTGFANINAIMHPPTMLLNAGWI
ncbi:MAG TPA: NADP transhydrogenase subunit alpha, partial [Firmicutes bacterium]|nr:NADP transhydrogenase subunit alpha [Bacillota bacterium]